MLKSRRGLLAAGLAVAVVGATGVASTLTAGAEQIPETRPVAAAATGVPPALLPWGQRPEKISRGRGGTSAKTLRAEGLDAAPNDTSGSTQPRGRYAPKGIGERSGVRPPLPPGPPAPSGPTPEAGATPTDDTDPTPPSGQPTPPTPTPTTDATTTATTDATGDPADPSTTEPTASAATSPVAPAPTVSSSTDSKASFFYSGGYQDGAVTTGFYANLTIAKPTLATSDYHTLAELALQSADQTQIVEVGWNIDRAVNKNDDPHLFVYHWVNGQETCYNACGFVQYSPNIKPGDTLATGAKKFTIQYAGNAWWIAFDTEWVGYFPESLWLDKGVSFATSGYLQVFGEVAASTSKPCGTQMGNGLVPASALDTTAALGGSTTYLNGPTVALLSNVTKVDEHEVYPLLFSQNPNTGEISKRTFRYGGPDTTTKGALCYVAPTTS